MEVEDTPSAYMRWNDLIAARYFRAEDEARPVYLYVTEEVIEEIGLASGEGVDDFARAVRHGPPWVTRSGLCQRAIQAQEGWRERGLTYPPYIAFLALFVLAAGHGGDFAPHSYYPRLRELLDEAGDGAPASFHRMLDLWDDLERWTTQDEGGQLGVFDARIVGGHIHIGLPLAQTILTSEEREALPSLFLAAGLDPTVPPNSTGLKRALVDHGTGHLRPRTLATLRSKSDASFSEALLDVVADELGSWHGGTEGVTDDTARNRVFAGLRLCLALDRVAATVSSTLRCRSGREFPDDGLHLSGAGADLACVAFMSGWSLPIADATTSAPFQPPNAAWRRGLALEDVPLGWRIRLREADVRIFSSGVSDGLPGLVERLDLPRRQPFYFAIPEASRLDIAAWGQEYCAGWRDIEILRGLPPGWTFASVDEAFDDATVRERYPCLAFPDRLRLRFVSGLRSSAGNSFFGFALPDVVLDGADGDETVECDGEPLVEVSPFRYKLPPELPRDVRVSLEVTRGSETIRRVSLYIASDFEWRSPPPNAGLSNSGQPIFDAADIPPPISGAIVRCVVTPEPVQFDVRRARGFPSCAGRTFLIGRCPGEISRLSSGPLPEWPIIWAIPFARKGVAIYCGPSLNAATPLASLDGEADSLEEWKLVMWRWRKRIAAPKDPALASLWCKYVEAARDA